MKIDLYTRCWNDADMLGFFFRHYDPIVRRYVVFDDGSDDNSLDIWHSHANAEIRPMPEYDDPDSRIGSNLAVLESCWKESRGGADWVIVTDIDEHLHHPDLGNYLAACKRQGVTIIPSLGYQMLADEFPHVEALLSRDLTMGAPDPVMSKMNLFSPNDIETANFAPGRHEAAPQGNVVIPERDELLLLHYKFLGFEHTLNRHRQLDRRQRKKDRAMSWGFHYAWPREQLRAYWDDLAGRLVDISDGELRPWATHPGSRWWRRQALR